MLKPFPASCLLIGTMTLAAADLAADESALEKLRARLNSAEQYGTECCQMLSIPAAAFAPRNAPAAPYIGVGFVVVASGNEYWAPVSLPSGAALDFIDLYYADVTSEDVCATLWAYRGPTLSGNLVSEEAMGTVCSTGSAGNGYRAEEISGTIDNSVWFSGGAQYAVVVRSDAAPGFAAFKGVTIWWHRQVRPAPGSATFNDVPVNHPQFQFIEALVESGITVGCGGGNYCPDNPVTRGQMAVFLAKALGLYWPF